MAEEGVGAWMDGMRKHHNEAINRYNISQPRIDTQIKCETLKYLKNGSTKPKPKPGARKRKPVTQQTMQMQQQQLTNQQQQQPQPQLQPPSQQLQQQPQQIYTLPNQYHPNNHPLPPHPQHPSNLHSHTPTHHHTSHNHHQYHHSNNNNNHHLHPSHQYHHLPHGHHMNHVLPDDLNLTLQAGLECDVDSLIKHEISVEGQLDFNHDLLLKLDNHYQFYHHHH